MTRLSEGAKVRAALLAGEIEFRALQIVGGAEGYATDEARTEMREIAAALMSLSQPHPGKHDDGRVQHCMAVIRTTGMEPDEAARWWLAWQQWQDEWNAATATNLRPLIHKLKVELESGLVERGREIPTKDVQRLMKRIRKGLDARRGAGMNVAAGIRAIQSPEDGGT